MQREVLLLQDADHPQPEKVAEIVRRARSAPMRRREQTLADVIADRSCRDTCFVFEIVELVSIRFRRNRNRGEPPGRRVFPVGSRLVFPSVSHMLVATPREKEFCAYAIARWSRAGLVDQHNSGSIVNLERNGRRERDVNVQSIIWFVLGVIGFFSGLRLFIQRYVERTPRALQARGSFTLFAVFMIIFGIGAMAAGFASLS